jgi:SAM-dependent methyltransferase
MSKSIGEQNYEQFARRYAQAAEAKPHNAYYDRPNTLSLLPDVNGLDVLDAGCGPGFYAEWLVERGARVVAFDVTPDFVDLTRERVGDRAIVLRADLEQPLTFAQDESFDLALCPLVLDYIEDWQPVFSEFYRILRPGGTLIFSCGHPFGDYLYYPHGSYFDTILFEAEWRSFGDPIPVIKSYRRPLSAVLNPLIAAGFHLDHLLEAKPTEQFKQADPKDYEKLMQQPGFLCVRARKG